MTKTARNSHLWDRHPEDWYVEPEWCSKRLFEEEKFQGVIWDPSCGMGRILKSASEAGFETYGSDIVDRGDWCVHEQSFFEIEMSFENIVGNPPYRDSQAFLNHALTRATRKVAFLLPLSWLTGNQRTKFLEESPLYRVYVLAPRPSMPPGPVIEAGMKAGGGTKDFAWFVWLQGYEGTPEIKFLRRDG